MTVRVSAEILSEYAHWKYQLDRLDSYDIDKLRESASLVKWYADLAKDYFGMYLEVEDVSELVQQILWLREEARYKVIYFEVELENITNG